MAQFEYQGINSSGKSVKGMVTSDNQAAAKSQLRRDGIFPSFVGEVTVDSLEKSGRGFRLSGFFKSVPVEDLATMTRQLATLISSHVPLVEALSALTDQVENEKLRAAISKVRTEVNEGTTFHKALSRFPDIFSDLYVNMVASGESSGALDVVLQRLADFLEYQDRLRKKVGSALAYPLLMIGVGSIAILVIFTKVIPEIENLFTENKATLPMITQIVLGISRFILSYWWAMIFIVGIAFEGVRRFLASEYGSRKWDEMKLKLPIFGDLIRMIAISRFTKTLGTLLKSGIPLLTSLNIVKSVVGNHTIMMAIEQATTDLTEGQNISDPLKRSGQFPPLVTHMISVGEKTGELEQMLEKVAEHYEYQVNTRIQSFTALLEPIMILILAGVVLVIVLSVILPMLELNNSAI
ncbi:MAG: type II secretion system inner membrane protein GspF [Deltaproteobacteria bacterium]|nr:type II secretion system inner membrane protein GspF [Deltaproteobacteria bacterium]